MDAVLSSPWTLEEWLMKTGRLGSAAPAKMGGQIRRLMWVNGH
jgi:hypothetical protein